jgi:hypothetical protein
MAEVSSKVNSPAYNTPDLLQPVSAPIEGSRARGRETAAFHAMTRWEHDARSGSYPSHATRSVCPNPLE